MSKLKIIGTDSKNFSCKKRGKKAEIALYGTIGETFFDDGITAKRFIEELNELKDVDSIDLRINSMGGDVFEGVTIYNRLKEYKATINVYVDGLAASIASVIAMAGDTVTMGEGSFMMVHSPMTGVFWQPKRLTRKNRYFRYN